MGVKCLAQGHNAMNQASFFFLGGGGGRGQEGRNPGGGVRGDERAGKIEKKFATFCNILQ